MDSLGVPDASGFPPHVFRADEIRGRVGQEIDARFAHALGVAVGRYAAELGRRAVVVGKDARLSSVALGAALQAGVRESGMAVIDIGMAATPLTWFAARLTESGAAVAVTGGHDDDGYNGFKIMLDGHTLGQAALHALRGRMRSPQPGAARPGARAQINAAQCYVSRLVSDIRLERSVKVALDCGHGVAGSLAPDALRELGCEVTELSCDMTGSYPADEPRPGEARYVADLAARLRYSGCELALSIAGDGDKVSVLTRSGARICADRLLILFARDILGSGRRGAVVHDIKSSRNLAREIQALGGTSVVSRGGDAQIADKMRETGALLGGETGGGIRFKDRWHGDSDGLYAAARLLELLSRHRDASQALDALPQSCATPELRLDTAEGEQYRLVEALRASGRFLGAREIIHLDGVRVEYDDGFGLARPAAAQPAVMLRFEGDNGMALSRIQEDFRRQLLSVAPGLRLPF
ncbi:phosphomannomutase/phosphoglucomutase [Bordetella bronchialis]|uniref:Phosphoglucomutase n=1 Tax=Bordetella bronchialis TaxID=463025 RepID=A0A193FW41_9BORD|nr:phosphomannomutase/phosphoglucomutase [Bordetella bronchialis]ANN66163.1 phosphoglucomutase [Bordetella bronchialis]ANN71244.1 phosphoglucomutase [Bordetella bronchialis]